MKKSNEEIDELIHAALNKEEAMFYDNLGEQSIIEMQAGVFQGKNKLIAYGTIFAMTLLFGGFIYSMIQVFATDNTNDLIKWIFGSFFCIMAVGNLKLWHWMQMDKNAIIREVKRLELQVSILTGHLIEKGK